MKTFGVKLLMRAGTVALFVTAIAGSAFAQDTSKAVSNGAVASAKASKKSFEVVDSAGLNIPDSLTPQSIEHFVDEDLVTTQAGQLVVTKSIELSATCTAGTGVLYYLLLDDVAIRNSTVFSRTGVSGQISGVTAGDVATGTHRIRIGEQCTTPGASVSGGTVTLVGITSVIVLN